MSPTCMPRLPSTRATLLRGIGCRRTGARLAMMKALRAMFAEQSELVLVLLLAGILLVLFTPYRPELLIFC